MGEHDDNQRARVADLEMRQQELESALAEMDHRARRLGDCIERQGVAAGELESERQALERNRRLNRDELQQVRAELKRLRGGNEGD